MDPFMSISQYGFLPRIMSQAEEDTDALDSLEVQKVKQINFFIAHKDENWFKNKYHPDERKKQKQKRTIVFKKRLTVFNEFLANGKIDSVSVDEENRGPLVRLLDSVLIKLEGGSDVDFTVFKHSGTSKIQLKPENEKTKTNTKTNASEHSDGLVDSDKKNETNKIDKSEVNNTEETMDVDVQNPEIFNVWKGRIWSVNGITNHFHIALNDMKLCADIINTFDMRSGLLQSMNCDHPAFDRMYQDVFSDLEETWAKEKELLGESVPFKSEVNSGIHIPLLKSLDRMILYLRIVYSIDFYNYTEYKDEMPSGSSVMHVRCPWIRNLPAQQEITDYCEYSQTRAYSFINSTNGPSERELTLLGITDEKKVIHNYIGHFIDRISHRNWLCKLSGKTFKSRRDARKNIIKNYSDELETGRKELKYFNNFLRDPNRPNQIPHSYPAANQYQMSG